MSTNDQRRAVSQALWLHYFNRTLLTQGLITERQHNQLYRKILAQRSAASSAAEAHCALSIEGIGSFEK